MNNYKFQGIKTQDTRHKYQETRLENGYMVKRFYGFKPSSHSATQPFFSFRFPFPVFRFPVSGLRLPLLLALCSLLVTLSAGTAHAQDSLSVYLETAAKNNPELKARYLEYSAALEKVPQVGSLPDPEAQFAFFTKPMELLGGDQLGSVQLMQMFPWFGTLKTARDEASLMALAKYEAFNSAKAELFYQIKASWYQLMKYDREIDLVRENIRLLESLEKLALVKFQSPEARSAAPSMQGGSSSMNAPSASMNSPAGGMGSSMNSTANQGSSNSGPAGNASSAGMQENMGGGQSGLADVLRVKMEILEQQNRMAFLTDQRKTEETSLNTLLNRDASLPVHTADSLTIRALPVNKAAIADSILQNNPMLTMLENEAGSYAAMKEKAKKMGLPMLGLGLNYMLIQERTGNTAMMNGKDMVMPMVSVSIPIYRKKYKAMQSEARMMEEATGGRSADLTNKLRVAYRQFVQDLDDAERRVVLYREQEELARKTTNLLVTGYTTTGNNYEEVLRMQLKALDYGFKHIEAIADYNTAIAMAEKLMDARPDIPAQTGKPVSIKK
jgi:outer membrane protein TolC